MPAMKAVFAEGHPENFPVASLLIPRTLRAPVQTIYRFARAADDVADEGQRPTEQRLALLSAMDRALHVGLPDRLGHEPLSEVEPSLEGMRLIQHAQELRAVLAERGVSVDPARRLMHAFLRDANFRPFDDDQDMLGYCRHSANPVGELMLSLWGFERDAPGEAMLYALSDHICTGLQLINFAQDIAQDCARGRPTFPKTLWPSHWQWVAGTAKAPPQLIGWKETESSTQAVLCRTLATQGGEQLRFGAPLVELVHQAGRPHARRLAMEIAAVVAGGRSMATTLLRDPWRPWHQPPRLGAGQWLALAARWLPQVLRLEMQRLGRTPSPRAPRGPQA